MTENKNVKNPLELYIHIPFCVRKCHYCDFLSGPADEREQDNYMEALLSEVIGRGIECKDYEVTSVFIGGGTPSVVDAVWISRLLSAVKEGYQLCSDAEITIEVNPGTVDKDKLHSYYSSGVNRLSIGLQSASDAELKKLGRIHTYKQFLETYNDAVAEGFFNINVDVMSALPGQTVESYCKTIHALLELTPKPAHISAYSLIIEEGTPFYELFHQNKLVLPDEESERLMYVKTKELLEECGYRRYEISNYSLPGYECRHNCGYWMRREYLGFGIGAASLMKEFRFRNSDDLSKYIRQPLLVREDYQKLTKEEQMEEFMFLGLRMVQGVSEACFKELFGKAILDVYGDVIQKNVAEGLLAERDGFYHLTDRGLDLSNHVMAQFMF